MQNLWSTDGNFSLFLTTVSNSLKGTNYVLWSFIKYSFPVLLVVQEAIKWPGVRRSHFLLDPIYRGSQALDNRERHHTRAGYREGPGWPLPLDIWRLGRCKERAQGLWCSTPGHLPLSISDLHMSEHLHLHRPVFSFSAPSSLVCVCVCVCVCVLFPGQQQGGQNLEKGRTSLWRGRGGLQGGGKAMAAVGGDCHMSSHFLFFCISHLSDHGRQKCNNMNYDLAFEATSQFIRKLPS
jgi:hypothetical protein